MSTTMETQPILAHSLREYSVWYGSALMSLLPAGIEGFFRGLGRLAEALEPPAGRVGPPDSERLRALAPTFGIEFASPGSTSR